MKAPTSFPNNVEAELKYGLDERGYRKLVRRFPGARRFVQRNHYFEDPRGLALRRAGCGLRIRFVRGKAPVLTLKCPAAGASAQGPRSFKVREEHEARLALSVALAVARGTRSIASLPARPAALLRERLAPEALARVVPIGAMTTTRLARRWRDGLVVEIDRFDVFGTRHYELEIETFRPKETDRLVRALFRELEIPYRPVRLSKLGRFLRAWSAHRKRSVRR